MGTAFFYHLTRAPLEVTLPLLLGKARAAGWRVAVRGTDESRLDWLDKKLWQGPEDGFLPHGLASHPHAALQPILLTTSTNYPNDPACLMLIDGAAPDPDEAARLERLCVLFDGHDTTAVEAARDHWKTLIAAGCAAQYWSEAGGRWEKKAEA
jgi:DNA polymerase-3 subunit chi